MNEKVRAYLILIQRGKLTLDEVPQEFRDEVEQALVPVEVEEVGESHE